MAGVRGGAGDVLVTTATGGGITDAGRAGVARAGHLLSDAVSSTVADIVRGAGVAVVAGRPGRREEERAFSLPACVDHWTGACGSGDARVGRTVDLAPGCRAGAVTVDAGAADDPDARLLVVRQPRLPGCPEAGDTGDARRERLERPPSGESRGHASGQSIEPVIVHLHSLLGGRTTVVRTGMRPNGLTSPVRARHTCCLALAAGGGQSSKPLFCPS